MSLIDGNDYYKKKDDEKKKKNLIPHNIFPYLIVKDLNESLKWGAVFHDLCSNIAHSSHLKNHNLINELQKVLEYGAKKYSVNSWQTVEDAQERYKNAFIRHVNNTDNTDKESGLLHYSHAMCNLMFLMWFELQEEKK